MRKQLVRVLLRVGLGGTGRLPGSLRNRYPIESDVGRTCGSGFGPLSNGLSGFSVVVVINRLEGANRIGVGG